MPLSDVLVEQVRKNVLRALRLSPGAQQSCLLRELKEVTHNVYNDPSEQEYGKTVSLPMYVEFNPPMKVVKELGWWTGSGSENLPILCYIPYHPRVQPKFGDLVVVPPAEGYLAGTYKVLQVKVFGQGQALAWVVNLEPDRSWDPGTVHISTNPTGIGASWTLTGPYGFSQSGIGPASIEQVDSGDYTITWGDSFGYVTPDKETLRLEKSAEISFVGDYDQKLGVIQISSNLVDFAWTVDGPAGFIRTGEGPVVLQDMLPGNYVIAWGAVTGYTTPDDVYQYLPPDSLRVVSGQYEQQGTVSVSPSIQQAPWEIEGPKNLSISGNGSYILNDAEAGTYIVIWYPVNGYEHPLPTTTILEPAGNIDFIGSYIALPGIVYIQSNVSVAPWSLVGPGGYTDSGVGDATLLSMPHGPYTVTWGIVDAHIRPDPVTQILLPGESIYMTGEYLELVTADIVTNIPTATWTLEGPGFTQAGTGTASITGLAPGIYTVTWGDISGYDTPIPDSLDLGYGDVGSFVGTYNPTPAILQISSNVGDSPWLVEGPGGYTASGSGDTSLGGLVPGGYTVTWGDIFGSANLITPESQSDNLAAGETASLHAEYIFKTLSFAALSSINQVDAGDVDYDLQTIVVGERAYGGSSNPFLRVHFGGGLGFGWAGRLTGIGPWSDICYCGGGEWLAVTRGSEIYASSDGGDTWSLVYTHPGSEPWSCCTGISTICLAAQGRPDATPIPGRVYRSINQGVSWNQTQPAGNQDHVWTCCDSGVGPSGSVFLLGNTQRLYRSITNGSSWLETRPVGNVDRNWSCVGASSNSNLLIAGVGGGRLYVSRNRGLSWFEVQPSGDMDRDWNVCSAQGNLLLASYLGTIHDNGGRIWYSLDYGVTWDMFGSSHDRTVLVASADGSKIFVAGPANTNVDCFLANFVDP